MQHRALAQRHVVSVTVPDAPNIGAGGIFSSSRGVFVSGRRRDGRASARKSARSRITGPSPAAPVTVTAAGLTRAAMLAGVAVATQAAAFGTAPPPVAAPPVSAAGLACANMVAGLAAMARAAPPAVVGVASSALNFARADIATGLTATAAVRLLSVASDAAVGAVVVVRFSAASAAVVDAVDAAVDAARTVFLR